MSRSIDLAVDVIDVWTAPLDVNDDRMAGFLETLSPRERKRVAALPEERAARQYVVSRAMQRRLLAAYVGGTPAEIEFGFEAMGKPTLTSPNGIDLRFNTTHSGNLVIIAISKGRDVGIDVEKVRPVPRALKVAKRCYSTHEYERLAALPADQLDRAFLSIWVKREGTAKARGDSVWRGLASWKGGEIEGSSLQLDWRVSYLELGPEFVGVVVARKGEWRVMTRSWSND